MNMKKENYIRFKSFCDYVSETANDDQVQYLMAVLAEAAAYAAEQCALMAEQQRRIKKTKN